MTNYDLVTNLLGDINKVFSHVTEDEDKIEPSDLIVLNKYLYQFINKIKVQPWLCTNAELVKQPLTTIA